MTLSTFFITGLILLINDAKTKKDIDRIIHTLVGLDFDENTWRRTNLYLTIYDISNESWIDGQFNITQYKEAINNDNMKFSEVQKEVYQLIVQLFDKWKDLN